MVVQYVVQAPHHAYLRFPSSIVSSGYCPYGVLHVLPVAVRGSSGFSFSTKNMLVVNYTLYNATRCEQMCLHMASCKGPVWPEMHHET